MEKKKFTANLTNLYPMLIFIRERITKYLNQKDLDLMELACEEVFMNIITHGYGNKGGQIEISIEVNTDVQITFKDKGKPFNPLTKRARIDKTKDIKKKKIGGVGIFLISKSMDQVHYERNEPYNILTLKKKRMSNY